MLPDVRGRRWCVFGLQGSGKSTLVHHILSREPSHLVVDPMGEYAGFNRYLPRHRGYPDCLPEFDMLVRRVVIGSGKVRLFVVDEASRFCPNRRPLPDAMAELNDLHRHYGVGFGVVARRPVQLHTDLVELAHLLLVFRLRGVNDMAYLNAIASGLGDAAAGLPEYHYVVVDQWRNFEVSPPVPALGRVKVRRPGHGESVTPG